MTHQIDVLSVQKCNCLSRCVRALIVMVKSDLFSAVGFLDFLEENWQTNGGKTLTSHYIFYVREQKYVIRCQVRTIRRMAYQIDVLSGQKYSCLSRCVRARIVVVKSDPFS